MVRTRKRSYGEEVSQSSSNIAYSATSRPKQFDQQEGKRQRVTSQSSLNPPTASMSKRNELVDLLSRNMRAYLNLLDQVCSGQEHTLKKPKRGLKNVLFWINFASKLCQNTGLDHKEGIEIACQHYCDDLRLVYEYTLKNSGPHPLDPPSREYWAQLSRIYGSCTPSTSTWKSSRSSQSNGSTSSSRRSVKKEVCDAVAKLAHLGHLEFDAVGGFEQYISKCKIGLHTFMSGSQEYRVTVVRNYARKHLGIDYQETEIPESM